VREDYRWSDGARSGLRCSSSWPFFGLVSDSRYSLATFQPQLELFRFFLGFTLILVRGSLRSSPSSSSCVLPYLGEHSPIPDLLSAIDLSKALVQYLVAWPSLNAETSGASRPWGTCVPQGSSATTLEGRTKMHKDTGQLSCHGRRDILLNTWN
jgi:hypothetical protein